MNELPSAKFRNQYAKLKEQTVVTVNGHPIGVWNPVWQDELPAGHRRVPLDIDPTVPSRQAQRDDLLRKINRGK
jgi:hypothetical protein